MRLYSQPICDAVKNRSTSPFVSSPTSSSPTFSPTGGLGVGAGGGGSPFVSSFLSRSSLSPRSSLSSTSSSSSSSSSACSSASSSPLSASLSSSSIAASIASTIRLNSSSSSSSFSSTASGQLERRKLHRNSVLIGVADDDDDGAQEGKPQVTGASKYRVSLSSILTPIGGGGGSSGGKSASSGNNSRSVNRRSTIGPADGKSLGGGDLLSLDSGFASRTGSVDAKSSVAAKHESSRKSLAPSASFRNNNLLLSPKHEVDEASEDGADEDQLHRVKNSTSSSAIFSPSVLGDTVVETTSNSRGGGAAENSTPVSRRETRSSSSSAKAAKSERERDLQAEIERITKERDEFRGKWEQSCAAADVARAEGDEIRAERDDFRSKWKAVCAERDELGAELKSVRREQDALRAERDGAVADVDSVRSSLSSKLEKSEATIKELEARVKTLERAEGTLQKVMKEYEQTMSVILKEKETSVVADVAELAALTEERDRLREELRMKTADLKETEIAFNSFHAKSERLKEAVRCFEANEQKLKQALEEARNMYREDQEKNLQYVRAAQEKVEWAQRELYETKHAKEIEVSALKAQLKLKETELSSVKSQFAQKEKEAKELSNIVEELLTSMGARK